MMPLDEQLSRSHNKRKANVILMGVSSALALVLAFVGIYGVVSYQVSRRIQEMGIRMALGAQPHNIVHLILKQSIVSAVVGLLLGIGGAFALTCYISSMLYGVTTTDPLVFIAISSLVFIISLTVGYISSRKTTKIRLAVALRNE